MSEAEGHLPAAVVEVRTPPTVVITSSSPRQGPPDLADGTQTSIQVQA